MQSLKNVFINKTFSKDKYLTRDFQDYGLRLAQKLEDVKHKALYIKLAKTEDHNLLENALTFVSDSNARNKGALFMWKLKQLKSQEKTNNSVTQ